jgi:hypothetical protein
MQQQRVRGLPPNLVHFYVNYGPRSTRSQSERADQQRIVAAREPVPMPSLPADEDRGRLQATV